MPVKSSRHVRAFEACEVIIDECLKGWKELEYEVVPMTQCLVTFVTFEFE